MRPAFIPRCTTALANTPIKTATVISFPHGTDSTAAKCAAVKTAIEAGAHEIDMVLNRTGLQGGPETPSANDYSAILTELQAVHKTAKTCNPEVQLKLILETSQLTREQVIAVCWLAYVARWEFVKTSTGFCGRGASVEDVALMRRVGDLLELGDSEKWRVKVKASGGIRTLGDFRSMVGAGAERVGASAGVGIVDAMEGSA